MSPQEPLHAPPRVAYIVCLGGIAIVILGTFIEPRATVLILSGFALAGALARIITPQTRAFAVRSRAMDVAVLGLMGLALGFLGLTTQLG